MISYASCEDYRDMDTYGHRHRHTQVDTERGAPAENREPRAGQPIGRLRVVFMGRRCGRVSLESASTTA